jgi:predicted Na+-dependent transporter
MIAGMEVAMIFLGLYFLIKGKTLPSKDGQHVVKGWPARLIGIICLMPIPLSIVALSVWGIANNVDVSGKSFFWRRTAIEVGILLACLVVGASISRTYRTPVALADRPSTEL